MLKFILENDHIDTEFMEAVYNFEINNTNTNSSFIASTSNN